MHDSQASAPHAFHGSASPQEAYAWAQRMFNRVLGQWASDTLALRRDGMDRPCVRQGWWERDLGSGSLGFPGSGADETDEGLWADAA